MRFVAGVCLMAAAAGLQVNSIRPARTSARAAPPSMMPEKQSNPFKGLGGLFSKPQNTPQPPSPPRAAATKEESPLLAEVRAAEDKKAKSDAKLTEQWPIPPLSSDAAAAMADKAPEDALYYAGKAEGKFWRLRVQSSFGQGADFYRELLDLVNDALPQKELGVERASLQEGFDGERLLVVKRGLEKLRNERIKVIQEGVRKGLLEQS